MADLGILIPTLRRSEKLAGIVRDLRENTATPFRVYFIAEEWDEPTFDVLEELADEQIVAVIGDYGSCAKAYNAGFKAATEPHLFLGNDDLDWPEGWEIPALDLVKSGTPIVGVNEGHGRLTCFSMVERDYILRESGVYDQPSTLCHPYASQYVDTELADYAKHRGVWGETLEGGVIHRHHEWGEADPNHPNYVKARQTVQQDYELYRRRREAWEAT